MVVVSNKQHLEYAKNVHFTNSRGESTVRIQEECFNSFNIAGILPKNSPLKKNIDKVFIRLLSGGLTDKFFQDSLRFAAFDNLKADSGDNQEQNQADQIDTSSVTQVDILQCVLRIKYFFHFLFLMVHYQL
ncbi:uncharacterized protein LOC143026162 [Oratosquilla oratoria]|uniref:uncharacterized protein LOC143026162 n=1 Tax=Oratosquilla oratoria TaxID=337810 RepID=UPI003F76C11A